MKSDHKNRSVSAKDELKSASSFLKNFNNNKGNRQEVMMKVPPLPPSFPKE
jgi:hypothetical protein